MISFKITQNFGDVFYLKTDPEQRPKTLISVILQPGSIVYVLRDGLEAMEVYDFEVNTEIDQSILLNLKD